MTISISEKRFLFGRVSVASVVITCQSAGCGGDLSIDKGTSQLGANGISSTSGDPDPGGVCTKHECGPPQPGDCPLAKCVDYQDSCAYGRIIHARCVPDPFAGQGSAPADQCKVIGDCSNEELPDADAGIPCDSSKCGSAPSSCVSGTPAGVACVKWPMGSVSCTWTYRCE